jgi:hypothetical protein
MANRPANPTTFHHPSKYLCRAVGGSRVDLLMAMRACPGCGKAIAISASYCFLCTKAAAR